VSTPLERSYDGIIIGAGHHGLILGTSRRTLRTGAFNAEQVMYNHFGYRTPVPNLYMAGSPCHPGGAISGGAGYIAASLIARDLGIETWWRPWDARATLQALAEAA
jgi:phytoene dehydrogenase-like protein